MVIYRKYCCNRGGGPFCGRYILERREGLESGLSRGYSAVYCLFIVFVYHPQCNDTSSGYRSLFHFVGL